jgi:hypothetical protein
LLGDLELNGLVGFLLHNRRAFQRLVTMSHIPYFELDKVTASQFAVNGQIEQGQLPEIVGELQPDPDFPGFT